MPRKPKLNMHPNHRAEYRDHIWRHNSYLGRVKSARMTARDLTSSASCTYETRHLAGEVEKLLGELELKLKERVDPAFMELYRLGSK